MRREYTAFLHLQCETMANEVHAKGLYATNIIDRSFY